MLTFVHRLSCLVRARLTGWRLPLAIAVFVFLTSWAAMVFAEPADTGIARPENYWWYFVVTAATVGYGDIAPTTTPGRLVGVYVIVGGIVTLTVLFTRLADHITSIRGNRMRGAVELDLEGHVVLLGYTPGRSERIVAELTAERRLRVVLCAWEDAVATDPLPEVAEVDFVRGDLSNADVMRRACVARARTVIIDGRSDDEALTIAVAVDHANPDVHLVAALRDLRRSEHFHYVNPRVQCTQWHMPYLLTEEALDPGITQVYTQLMSSGEHGNTYSLRVPAGFPGTSFGDCQTHLGRHHSATVLALRGSDGLRISPGWQEPVSAGDVLYYVGSHRLTPQDLDARR
ncbi:voltage-gated potassium channel [Kineococcus xinjiangensis]|uniref:Voltage-gated potassium channel n=1 Tax=Kineococcus xinjiangensis TaxID=512762 RepID=A0A2S6IM01_9ACTN|nr:ion channel [Kineococcus xinjiangensis]PPK95264.1 voltage-gated potassium channel [Kineococcus xinjiangensis]